MGQIGKQRKSLEEMENQFKYFKTVVNYVVRPVCSANNRPDVEDGGVMIWPTGKENDGATFVPYVTPYLVDGKLEEVGSLITPVTGAQNLTLNTPVDEAKMVTEMKCYEICCSGQNCLQKRHSMRHQGKRWAERKKLKRDNTEK